MRLPPSNSDNSWKDELHQVFTRKADRKQKTYDDVHRLSVCSLPYMNFQEVVKRPLNSLCMLCLCACLQVMSNSVVYWFKCGLDLLYGQLLEVLHLYPDSDWTRHNALLCSRFLQWSELFDKTGSTIDYIHEVSKPVAFKSPKAVKWL